MNRREFLKSLMAVTGAITVPLSVSLPDSVTPRISNGKVFFLSTPNGSNEFYREFLRNQKEKEQ
jgi:hypothetical protein